MRFVRIASQFAAKKDPSEFLCLSAFRADCIYLDDCVEGREEAFASARFVRIASLDKLAAHYNLPRLCLSAFRADCIGKTA